MLRDTFQTTTSGLNRNSFPMKLYEKAKRLGIWNPTDIDFSQDVEDWGRMSPEEQNLILRLTSLFQGGEEAVTLDLLPLIQVIAREGRIEEEIYLTTFLFEEAKHTDFFRRFVDEVTKTSDELSQFHDDNYKLIFYQALPEALQALQTDQSPIAQARASTTYNIVVEGMLAETGYHAYFTALERNDLLPSTRKAIWNLKQDESRHIAYGLYLLTRLLSEHEEVWEVIETTINTLTMPALGIISDAFSHYEVVPFGLNQDEFVNYAMMQLQKRYARLQQSRGASLEDIQALAEEEI
ncbi:MAG: ribonucleotide-diphosphate reductase [Phototrophicales bacterium]|nr:MAG: ribonucleotide-diphosphate reductase [Phototrophicales bacterium]